MVAERSGAVVRQIQSLFQLGNLGSRTDGELLQWFASRRDDVGEAAFGALVQRHGPMVLALCRKLLRNDHDAEDAFQATFLVLSRCAVSIRKPDLLANWLYGVALRTARKAKGRIARRRRLETHESAHREPALERMANGDDRVVAAEWLHEELARLPETFRLPIVLCHLDGLTHDQAAACLQWPAGTVRSRMARGRERLRDRLMRRGLPSGAAIIAAELTHTEVRAGVPAGMLAQTTQAATHFAAGSTAAGMVSATVVSLANGVMNAMFMTKLSLATACLLAVTLSVAAITVSRAGPPENVVVPPTGQAAKEQAASKFVTLDLQAWANQALNEGPGDRGNSLARLSAGKFTFEGTEFQVGEKTIHLQGQHGPDWPEKVKGIKVGSTFHQLKILHANQQAVDNLTEIGRYVIHYADGTEVRIPLIFGENIANWFSWPAERKKSAAATAAIVAWNGKNEASDLNPGLEIHLYCMTWKNPHPEKKVDTIDFVSRNTLCDPFLVALTLETK